MNPHTFGAFIEHEQVPPKLAGPPKLLLRDTVTSTPCPSVHELDDLHWGDKLNGPTQPPGQVRTSQTPRELEQSVPPTPDGDEAVDALVHSATNPPMNKWRLAAAAVMFFLMGINDSATGALIPYMEQSYNIGYAIVSLIFISNAVGFILAAPLVQMAESYFGRSKAYIMATTLMSCGYIALVCAPPFAVVVVAFSLLGFGMGTYLAMTNAFIVNLVNGTVILGAMHGLYGLGGVVSPLMATAMVSKGVRWSYYYFVPLGLAVFSIAFMGWSYKDYEKDSSVPLLTALERTASRRATAEAGEPTKAQVLARAIKNRTTLLGALFIFAYQGAEVSISGWVISFLIYYRKGNPAQVGNVTSGFWAGITLGRFILTHFAHKIGEKAAVVGLIIGAAVFQLLVWLVPNIVGNAVAESIVGFLLGPVYPCATAVFARLLPRNIQITSLGFVGSMGSSGGALAPFVTGLLAQKLGTVVLHPVCIALFVLMEISWLFLPAVHKRQD